LFVEAVLLLGIPEENIDICYDLDGKQYLIHVNQLSNAAETPSKFTTFVDFTTDRNIREDVNTEQTSTLIRETTSFQEGTQLQTLFPSSDFY
jgi:hypothetical protein